MCVLRVSSKTTSFENFLKNSSLPAYDCHEKGDIRLNGKRPPFEHYGFLCGVSDKEWDDFNGQVEDAVYFLQSNLTELESLITQLNVDDIRLDFPVNSRLVKNNLFSQCDYLPPKLIKLAGKIGIGIEISQYWPSDEKKK